MAKSITVTYIPDEDRVEGAVDGKGDNRAFWVEWSEDVRFSFVGRQLVGFEVRDFRYFTDFLPFYKLFGADFVGWLSDLQSEVTMTHRADRSAFALTEQSKSGKRFESALAAG